MLATTSKPSTTTARHYPGRNQEATQAFDDALALCQVVGDRHTEAYTLDIAGRMLRGGGTVRQGAGISPARSGNCEPRETSAEKLAVDRVARVEMLLAMPVQSVADALSALQIYKSLDDRRGEAKAQMALARAEAKLALP